MTTEAGWYTPPSASNDNAADQFLTGGGVPSAFGKDDPIGTTVAGTIVDPAPNVKQQTDIQTGKPLTWDNGDPRMQLVVTIQQDGIQVTDEDDGKRRLYVKGSKTPGTHSMHDAVATAVRDAGARGLEVGGRLVVQFFGTQPSDTRGFNDRKLWRAQYAPPAPGAVSGGFLGTTPTAAPQAPQPMPPMQPPAPQYAPPTAPPQQWSPPPAPPAQAPPPQYAPPAGPPEWATPAPGPVQGAPSQDPWANAQAAPASPPQPVPAPQAAPAPAPAHAGPVDHAAELAAYEQWKASQGQ